MTQYSFGIIFYVLSDYIWSTLGFYVKGFVVTVTKALIT